MLLLEDLVPIIRSVGEIEKLGIIGILVLVIIGQWYSSRTDKKKLQADNDKLSDFILREKLGDKS